MRRGEIYWSHLPHPAGDRPVLVVARESILRREARIMVAPISTHVRGLDSEIDVGPVEGLTRRSAAQCDGLYNLELAFLDARPIGRLGPAKIEMLDDALRYALDIRCPQP